MPTGHSTYVETKSLGSGRSSYRFVCTCGRQGGRRDSHSAASQAGRRHEKTGR
ncbi:hypothetical protein JS756_03040 [Streptomyces actuosus]|uniref:Mobile element transfer n=1 Tax=Streptomyces actuosus TaxID=1885 RepID=A0ABS2VJ26_STRAS|nr:hypothetical protein [Streptomyces actuosus]MBN0043105.1 hypothetical protein [Streptomyces actuosus]